MPKNLTYSLSRRQFHNFLAASAGANISTALLSEQQVEARSWSPEYHIHCQKNSEADINLTDIADELYGRRQSKSVESFKVPLHGHIRILDHNKHNLIIRFTPINNWTGRTYFNVKYVSGNISNIITIVIDVTQPRNPYDWTHSIPNAFAIDSSKIKIWYIGSPIPNHKVGDIILGVGPDGPVSANVLTGVFKGPLFLIGLTLYPKGTLASSYSTSSRPVLGTTAVIRPTFTSDARSHWVWEGKNWAFLYIANTYIDYQKNNCSFGDFVRIRQLGVKHNSKNGSFVGPKSIVIMNKIYMKHGPHYISNTVNPKENGHSDGIQSLGGVPVYRIADSYFNLCGGQLFFSGREASDCGWPRETRWDLRNVAMDHSAFWNTNVRAHSLNKNPQFIKAYESQRGSYEVYNYDKGKYMAVHFGSQCYVRGQFSLADKFNIRKYISGPGGIVDVDARGQWIFSAAIKANHKYPAYSGSVRYVPPAASLPETCDPRQTGCNMRITSVDQFMRLIRA